MNSVLILGVGGTGSRAVDMMQKKIERMGMHENAKIVSIVLDTNLADEESIDAATIVSLSANGNVKMVRDRLGAAVCNDFFPTEEKFDSNNLSIGAGQWRKQSFLAFLNAMSSTPGQVLEQKLQELIDPSGDSNEVTIYTVASLAGGTGSGSFIPLAFYVKKYLKGIFKNVQIKSRAMLACPDIYEAKQNGDHMNITKIYANAYAILRELNAINQVVYGKNNEEYDNGSSKEAALGRTPIRIHYGTPSAKVGVLFDSEETIVVEKTDPKDPTKTIRETKLKYASPDYAPFNTVFLMEKINGVSSVEAHDEAMANILYSLVCTRTGGELDSIWSNQEGNRSNASGHNRLFAGIGCSEIQYPAAEILEYIARRKTLEDAEGAWLKLHDTVKEKIDTITRQKREMKPSREYNWTELDYADHFLAAYESEAKISSSDLTDMLKRSMVRDVKERGEVKKVDILRDEYWERVREHLVEIVPDCSGIAKSIAAIKPVENPGFFAKSERSAKANKVCENAKKIYNMINDYYCKVVEEINSNLTSLIDAILPTDSKKDPVASEALSFATGVLSKDGYYLHPVAAMLQLCNFRRLLQEKYDEFEGDEWNDIGRYAEGVEVPASLLSCSDNLATLGLGNKTAKSVYLKGGKKRFAALHDKAGIENYKNDQKSTDFEVDSIAIVKDGDAIITKIYNEACEMLLHHVVDKLIERVDAMMKSYRAFFTRFSEQKKSLKSKVEKAEKAKSTSNDSSYVLVGASVEARRAHYEKALEAGMGEAKEGNSIAGQSVFKIAYLMTCARFASKDGKGKDDEQVDASSVFEEMYKATLEQLKNNSHCQDIAKKNVVLAIAEDYEGHEQDGARKVLQTAYNMAQATLKVTSKDKQNGPKNQAVILAPEAIVETIKDNAALFGIKINGDGNDNASKLVSEFVSKNCPEANVKTSNSVPKNAMFLCRVLMSVDPTEIDKVNEASGEDGYYKRYLEAIRIAEKEGNDSMFPHLGFGWHHRDRMPLINPVLNEVADRKMVKALLYGIMEAEITFDSGCFRYSGERIVGTKGFATQHNLIALVEWMRPKDALINDWSDKFDRAVVTQLERLPNTAFASDIGPAKTALTQTNYLRLLRSNIFANIASQAKKDDKEILEKSINMNIFQFARRISIEEEKIYDCNDAEKILRVASDLLWSMCEYVVSSEKKEFEDIYMHELQYFMAELCIDEDFQKDINNKAESVHSLEEFVSLVDVAQVKQLIDFAARAGTFLSISFNHENPNEGTWKKDSFDIKVLLNSERDKIAKCLEYRIGQKRGISKYKLPFRSKDSNDGSSEDNTTETPAETQN